MSAKDEREKMGWLLDIRKKAKVLFGLNSGLIELSQLMVTYGSSLSRSINEKPN